MRALNIYMLTRNMDYRLLPLYEKALSNREVPLRMHREEIAVIREIVDMLETCEIEPYCYENWFYSFTIPQIGKEFDLLKISPDGKLINLEIKSTEVSLGKISKQLVKNRYYLSHAASTIYSFTCLKCRDGIKTYRFDYDGLHETSVWELVQVISEFSESISDNIENMFSPNDYLMSPLNSPDKFLSGKYYLNNQQETIKNKILESTTKKLGLWGIRGTAGTGKTLLLFDLARVLAQGYHVGFIHCGLLSEGHRYLSSHLHNISIIDDRSLSEEWLSECQVICVDETQRLRKSSMDMILNAYSSNKFFGCIFSYDFEQALSRAEIKRNNPQRLNELPGFHEEKLSQRVRSNREMDSFIRNMLKLSDRPNEHMEYNNIDILYANDISEANSIKDFYRNKGYTYITFTPARPISNGIGRYSGYINSLQAIGCEFHNVILVMDHNFSYDENGELQGGDYSDPDYIFSRIFYQNISRTMEKLCLVILDNKSLFERLLDIKENQHKDDIYGDDPAAEASK